MNTMPENRTSTPQLVRSIADDTRLLIRKEIELVRHEIIEAVVARIKGAAALVAGGVLLLLMLAFGGSAAASALDESMEPWQSRLIVAAGFLVLGVGAALFARLRMSRPPIKPEETARTVKEDIEWAKAQLKR